MNGNRILRLALIVLFIACSPDLRAQKVATSALQFLKVTPSARATAMGDAFVASAWGIDGVFWNPGAVAGLTSHEFTTTYTKWLFDTRQYALAYGLDLGDPGRIAVQFQMTDLGTFKETRTDMIGLDWGTGTFNPGFTGNTFTPGSWMVGLTYARQLTAEFSAGLTAKYVRESLWSGRTMTIVNALNEYETVNTYAGAMLFDFGMVFNTGYQSIVIGAAVQNFGAQVKFAREEFSAPMTLRLGIRGDLVGPDPLIYFSEDTRVTLEYDMVQPTDYNQQMHIGAEYTLWNTFSIRGGYKFNYDSDGLTLGAGVGKELSGARVTVDYSYGSMGEYLGNVHRISLGVGLK
jgi:hypothetical protein